MTVATYDTPDPNEWVRPVALGVTSLLILWNVVGWFADKGWSFEAFFIAAMTGAFALLSFNASAQMRRASSKVQTPGIKRARKFWAGVLFMCSGWSAYSAHHAFGILVAAHVDVELTMQSALALLANAPALVVLTVAAFVEPFLPWAIETVEAAPRKDSMPEVVTIPPAAPQNAAKTVARELMRQAPRNASKRRGGMSEARGAARAPPLTEQQLREAVSELTQQGEVISIRRVAKHLDVPPSRVERAPARHLVMAVAA